MVDWIVTNSRYVFSNWQLVLLGGVIVVGIVMFLMGLFKKFISDKIKNKDLRKAVLFFSSIILAAPATLVYMISNGIGLEYFLCLYLVNSVLMIVFYQFYECTSFRKLLSLIGKNAVTKYYNAYMNSPSKNLEESLRSVAKTVNTDTKSVLKTAKSKYKDNLEEEL